MPHEFPGYRALQRLHLSARSSVERVARSGEGAVLVPRQPSGQTSTAQALRRETRGIGARLAKGKQFRERCEVHGAHAGGPFPHGDRIAALLRYDVTERATGERRTMQEIAVNTIQGGKVVREEFYYAL